MGKNYLAERQRWKIEDLQLGRHERNLTETNQARTRIQRARW